MNTQPCFFPLAERLTLVTASGAIESTDELRYEDENIWLTQNLMAALYDVSVAVISQHLKRLIEDGEIDPGSAIKRYLITAADGEKYNTKHYNLQATIAVGFRVESPRAVQFRKWAAQIVKDYAIRGWTMDVERLKSGHMFTDDYFERQLEVIRDIRASERRFYQKITDIYATAFDYDPSASTTRDFFALVQSKLQWTVNRHAAAELTVDRADADKPCVVPTTWKTAPTGKIVKTDASIINSYLADEEIDFLNRIVSMYLDYAELQAIRKVPMSMQDWATRLDGFLEFNELEILTGPGKISHEQAKLHAETEFEKYRITQDQLFVSDFDRFLTLESATEALSSDVEGVHK